MNPTDYQELDQEIHIWLDKILTLSRVSLEVNGHIPTVAFAYYPSDKDAFDTTDAQPSLESGLDDCGAINMPSGAIIQIDCANQPRKEASFKSLKSFLNRHKAQAVVMLTEAEVMVDTGETQIIQDSGLVLCKKVCKQDCVAIQMEAKGRYFLGQVILVEGKNGCKTFGEISLEEVGLDELPGGCTTRLLSDNEESKIVTGDQKKVYNCLGANILSKNMRVESQTNW